MARKSSEMMGRSHSAEEPLREEDAGIWGTLLFYSLLLGATFAMGILLTGCETTVRLMK